uniref:Uncharacterized protein n=1 Tax=Anguilla anguilla TaxID=7936 RepID=A0A0E9UQJ6_ANGAN
MDNVRQKLQVTLTACMCHVKICMML